MAGYVPLIGESVKEILLGGTTVGSAALLRFYVLHVAVLPAAIVVTLSIHLWRWRKDAMLDIDRSEPDV
jgi:quinol-cytochrome oxidoreductase complex cytochrome b subunit